MRLNNIRPITEMIRISHDLGGIVQAIMKEDSGGNFWNNCWSFIFHIPSGDGMVQIRESIETSELQCSVRSRRKASYERF